MLRVPPFEKCPSTKRPRWHRWSCACSPPYRAAQRWARGARAREATRMSFRCIRPKLIELEFDRVPARGLFVARLTPDRINQRPLIPVYQLIGQIAERLR